MGHFFRLAALVAAAVTLLSTGADAQSSPVLQRPAPIAGPNLGMSLSERTAKPGPIIYVSDAAGELSTITLGTYAVHRIGAEGTLLTDIGFDPKNGELYGISFSSFYRVSRTTGRATYLGDLGISDANALVFDAQGHAYTAGVNSPGLYTIDVTTGHVTLLGTTSPFRSAGDLTFYNDGLVLSGYYQSTLGSTTPETLVLLNPKTGAPLAYAELNIANLFGLVSTGKNLLFGFAGTSVYQLFPDASTVSKRSVLLKTLTGKGLAQIYGAAYDGEFQY